MSDANRYGSNRIRNIVLTEQGQNKLNIAPAVMDRECGTVKTKILNLLYLE